MDMGFQMRKLKKFFPPLNNLDFEKFWQQNERRLFDEIISKSPEFDANLYNNMDSIWKQKNNSKKRLLITGKPY